MAFVVNGPDGCSGGLLRCVVAARHDGYDHQRCFASKHRGGDKSGEHQDNYDFVVFRKDGTSVRFHPTWTSKEFNMYEKDPHGHPVRPPRNGCGGSDGSGTYKHYKNHDRTGVGWFDPDAGNGLPPNTRGYP